MTNETSEQQFGEVEANLEKSGRVEELIRLYESRSREVPDHDEAGNLLARAGELARERLRNLPRAEELFRRALVYAPRAREALGGLKSLYEQRQDHAQLADVLERLAALTEGTAAAPLYLRAADLHENRLGRKDRAVLCCQLAARANPQERQAFQRARKILLAEARYLSAWESLERERAALGDRDLGDAYLDLAQHVVDDPFQHELARKALDRAAALDPDDQKVAALRKQISALESGWKERVRQLRSQSLEERDRRLAARLSLQVARLYSFYDSAATAKLKEALDRCFLLWPAMPDALDLLEKVAEKAGDWNVAVAVFQKLAKDTKDKAAQVDLHLRMGTIFLTRLNDREQSLDAFVKAATIDPGRADAAGLASELLIEGGKVDEGVGLLEKHLGTLKDKNAQVILHLRLADLWSAAAKQEAAARKHLEAAHRLDPNNALAAFRLARVLADAGELDALWPLVELAVTAPRPVPERVAFCEAVGMAYDEAGDAEKAFVALAQALPLDPTRPGLLTSLEEAAAKAKAESRLAQSLRRAAQVAPKDAALALWKTLARLLQGPLARPIDAQEAWLEVQRRAPQDPDVEPALQELRKAIAREDDPRARLEAEARRLEASAADPAAASAVYRKILEIEPDSVNTLKKLGAVCSQLAQWEEVAVVAERLMALADSATDRQEWRWRLAQLYAERLERKDEAARLYLNLLVEGVEDAGVIGGLERLASQGVRQAEISRALGPYYEKKGDHQRQVASLLVQLSSVQEKDEQKGLLTLLAEVSEKKLIDSRAAFEHRLRGLTIDPSDSTFRAEAVRLAIELRAHAELARFLSDLAGKLEDKGLAISLYTEAGEVAEEGGAIDDAATALRSALGRSPEDPELLSLLVHLFFKARRWSECDQALRRLIAVAEPRQKAQLYVQLSQVNTEQNRPRDAATALSEAIKAGASEEEHLPRLALLLEEGGRPAELSEVMERLVKLAEKAGDKERASSLKLRRAKLIETSLGDKAEAVRRYADVLKARPTDPDAITALEHLLADPACREDAAQALLPAYEAQKDHRKQVAALSVIAESAKDAGQRVDALRQVADLHGKHLRQPEQAFVAMVQALRLSPGDPELRAAARSSAEAADTLDTYAEVLAEIAELDAARPFALALHGELSDIYANKLDNHGEAVKHLQAVLGLDPKNLDALKSLLRLHRAKEQWQDVVGVLERLSVIETDPHERTALDREIAVLAEQKLQDLDRAASAWRQIAVRDALSKDAATALDRLYTQADRPHELAFALELRRNQEAGTAQARELSFRLAQLRQNKLEDPEGALQLYRQLLAEDPTHEGARNAMETWARSDSAMADRAMESLDPVLAQVGDHAKRLQLREARLNRAGPQERVRLAAEIRAIYERDMNQPQAAFMSALKAFTDGLDREAIRPELERLAQATQSFEELAEIYDTCAQELQEGDPEAIALYRRAAQLREQLGQPDEATRLWNVVLGAVPKDGEALDALGRLYEKSQNAKNLSEVFAKKAALSEDPAERFDLLCKAGEAYEAAGDDARAIEAWRGALAIKETLPALLALDQLYGRARAFADQAQVLDQLADAVQDDDQRKVFVLRRAALLEREGNLSAALSGFGFALQLSPLDAQAIAGLERLVAQEQTKLDAAKLLEPCYRKQNDLKKLVEVLEIRLLMADASQQLALLAEIAALREGLGQKSLAFAARLRIFGAVPNDPAAREELERIGVDMGAFEELAAAFEDAIERGVEEPAALELWRRLAVLYSERLQRVDLAARALNEVLRREPRNTQVLDALSRIYRRTSNFRELAMVMRRQLALEVVVENQVGLLFELANLSEETLADKALAAQCYQEILERKPDEANAIRALARVLSETERYPELAVLIGREIQLAESRGASEEALELGVRLGRLKAQRLGDPKGALTLYQEVLRRRPAHAGAIGALEEMAKSDGPLKAEAAVTLEPVFAREGEHLKLVQMLESRIAGEDQIDERVNLRRKIAEVYVQQLGNPASAFLAAMAALQELPDDQGSLDLCLQLYVQADLRDEMVGLLEEVAPRAMDDAARARLYRELARLQLQAQDAEAAVAAWKQVLQIFPSDGEALEAIGKLLARQGKVPQLLEVLRKQLAIAEEPAQRAALLLQIGVLQDDHLKDGNGAVASFRKVLELSPGEPVALERMERLCEAQDRWPELADVIAKRIEKVSGDLQLELKYKLGLIRETKLIDKIGAVELYTDLLSHNPRHPGAITRMEALVAREPNNPHAVEVLVKAYRQSGDLTKLSQLIEARVAVSPDPMERKNLLLELATFRDAQEETELAYLALHRAFKEDPNDPELRRRMEAAANAAGLFEELVSAYEEELPRIAEGTDAADVCIKVAQTLDLKLKEGERAASFYEKARELKPEVAPKVLPALDRIYGQLQQYQDQARVLELLAAAAEEPPEKMNLYFRLGQVALEKLDSPDRAAGAFEHILEVDPKHLPSARALEQLYEAAGKHDKLYRVLEIQLNVAQGPEKERILTRMASVSVSTEADVSKAIDLYKELLQKNPRNEQAFQALDGLLIKAGRFDELKAMLDQKLKVTIDPRELVRLNERVGRVLFQHLDQPEAAIPHFKAALERDARHRLSLEALKDVYEKLGKRDDLIIVLRRLIPLQEEAQGTKALRLRLAEILASMNRREEALDAARRALEVEPHSVPELERAHQVFTQLKAWGDAVKALELLSQVYMNLEDREAAAKALFQVADLWRGPGNKPESAGPILERVLELDPANRQAYEQALELYQKVSDWRGYAAVMDRYLASLVTDEEKVITLRDLARVQEQKLGQKDVAFARLCRALELQPSDADTREHVERLAAETGSWDELALVYEQIADALPRGPLAEKLYHVLATTQDTHLDDADAAVESYRKILEFDPINEAALDALAQVYARRDMNAEYVEALEQRLEATTTVDKRKEVLREIARVQGDKLGDAEKAATALLRALEIEPDQVTLQSLVALYRGQKDWTSVASALLRLRDLAPTPEDRSRVQVEIAQVYEREIQDDEAAIDGYRQALEFDPSNAEALESLERLYTKLDRPGDLLQIYERQLELTQDYRDRTTILFRSAAIWEERYGNLQNADACMEAVLAQDAQNLQAIKTLERLRKAQGRWDELIGVVDRHIHLLTHPVEKAELLVEVGDIFHQQLKQVDRAVEAYQQALELNPRCRPAMHALGMLYERSGNWPFALEMLEREAHEAGATQEAVDLLHRMGKINEDMLVDPGSAKRCYLEALQIDPGYLPCIRALKGIYEIEKDWPAYEQMLVQEAEKTEEPLAKSKACLDVARYFLETKEDRETAQRYYEEALRLAPDSLDAARPLADIYSSAENWEGAERMLHIVTTRMAEEAVVDPAAWAQDLCRQNYRLGYVAEKNGRKDRALQAYEAAYQLDATYLPVLEGYSNLLVQVERYDDAQRVVQSILMHHREDLTDLEVIEHYWTLGDINLRQKQYDSARNYFDKALKINGAHEPSLRSMVEIADALQDWEKAAEFRQSLIGVLEGEDRFQVALALGAIARDKLSDPYMAIDAFLAAHRVKGEALEALDALYVLYRETRQGQRAAESLEKMLATEALKADPARAKRVWYALGEIARDELHEYDRAEAAFNSALDCDFRFVEAFSALEAMLGQQRLWQRLEENYARMIQRFPKGPETHVARMTIWKALGDLYLKVLKKADAACEVYKVVAQGLPDDAGIQEAYAELAAQQAGGEDQAIEAYRRALPGASNPGKIASALAELAARKKDYDSAWLAAQVVAGLIGEAGPGEKEILAKLTPYAKKKEVAQRALTDRLWHSHLFHPRVRGPLSELMAILFEQAGHLYKEDLARYHVNPRAHQIDIAGAQEYQLHHFRYVSRLLGMENVAVYSPFLAVTRLRMQKKTAEIAPEPSLGIEICHTHPPCLKLGGKFFSETGQKETYYALGRSMALLRPELALSQRLSAERLEAVVQAAISMGVERFRFTADMQALTTERRALERALPEPARAALARVAREYAKSATPSDLRNYLEGAELSAVRAGMFVAGEIDPVKKMVLSETGAAYRVQARSKIRDLMVFALGEDLHALRVAVGTHVEVQLRR